MELVVKIRRGLKTQSYYNFLKYLSPYSAPVVNVLNVYNYSTKMNSRSTKRCYRILGVADNSDQETVREAFVTLVKKYHPDSGSPTADAVKFQEIENAYRQLQEKFSRERWNHNDCAGEYGLYYVDKNKSVGNVEEQDIKHTAPQHRQYLSYDGHGIGTPSQREKQYRTLRAETAANSVLEYRVNKIQSETECTEAQALVVKDKKQAKKIKTRYGFERLVEDLIQESMARGEFDNLSGQGKPLGRQYDHYNPYVDLVTHKLNQVLIDNGFKPEWIALEKEIGDDRKNLRLELETIRSRVGPVPLNDEDELTWEHSLMRIEDKVKKLNSKITKFNLVVPLLRKQMFQFDLKREAETVLVNCKPKQRQSFDKESIERKLKTKKKEESLLHDIITAFFH